MPTWNDFSQQVVGLWALAFRSLMTKTLLFPPYLFVTVACRDFGGVLTEFRAIILPNPIYINVGLLRYYGTDDFAWPTQEYFLRYLPRRARNKRTRKSVKESVARARDSYATKIIL